MPRTAGIIVILLTLATGVALGRLASFAEPSLPVVTASDRQSAEVAWALYDAINEYLAGDNADGISQFLAPDYADHANGDLESEQGQNLLAHLSALRQTFPGLRLDVHDVSAQAGIVIVEFLFVGNASTTIAGLELDMGQQESVYDVLRVEDRLVAERWSSWNLPSLYRPVVSTQLDMPEGSLLEVKMDRLIFGAGGHYEVLDSKGFVIVPESGSFAFELIGTMPGTDDNGVQKEETRTPIEGITFVEPGESISVPAGAISRISTTGAGSAVVVSFGPVEMPLGSFASGTFKVIDSAGVRRSVIAGSAISLQASAGQSCIVHIGRVDLKAGAWIPARLVAVTELVVVTQGALDIRVDAKKAVWRQPDGRFVIVNDQSTISKGSGLRVNAGAIVEYKAAERGPVTFWRLAVETCDTA